MLTRKTKCFSGEKSEIEMRDILEGKFIEWIKDRTLEERKIGIFEKIRDIPYAVLPELFNPETGTEDMILKNKGFCVPKHYLLGIRYQKLGIDVRYCTYSFKWNDLGLEFPLELRAQADILPVAYHLACRVFIGGKWVFVDATWDAALKKAGFPVNENWDGKSDMTLAVKPIEETTHDDTVSREAFMKDAVVYSLAQKLQFSRFSMAFNSWLEELRAE